MTSFIIAVTGGHVAEFQQSGIKTGVSDSSKKDQHWTIEYSPDKENVVAFQNARNGQYMRALTGAAYGTISTGKEKQWWTLEQGHAPGSCWVKCNDYPDAYLCNSHGNYTPNNVVYVWPKQEPWVRSLLWYFRDANAPGWLPTAGSASAAADDGKQADELKKREAELVEREAKVKDLEQKEAASKKREAELVEREAKVKDLDQKEAALKKKEQDLAASEAAQKKEAEQLAATEKELANKPEEQPSGGNDGDSDAKQAELQKKLDELRAAERDLAAKEAGMKKREQQNTSKEDELKKKEAELASAMKEREQQNTSKEDELKKKEADFARKQATAQATPQQPSGGPSEADLLKAENENLKLQLKLKELEMQLAEARRNADPGKAPAASQEAAGNADEMAKLKEENARLKNLIAQQVRQKGEGQQQPPSQAVAGGASKTPARAPATNGHPAGGSAPHGTDVQDHAVNANGKPNQAPARGSVGSKAPPSTNGSVSPAKGPTKGSRAPPKANVSATRNPLTPTHKLPTEQQLQGASASSGAQHNGPSKSPAAGSRPSKSASGTTAKPSAFSTPGAQPNGASTGSTSSKEPTKPAVGANGKSPLVPTKPASGTTAKPSASSKPGAQPNGASTGPTPSKEPTKPAAGANGKSPLFPTKPTSTAPPAKKPESELDRLRAENAKLKQEQKDMLAKQKQGTAGTSAEKDTSKAELSAASASKKPGGAHAVHPTEEDEEDAIRFSCGHVAYPPPRKVRKNMVGILYSGEQKPLQVQNR